MVSITRTRTKTRRENGDVIPGRAEGANPESIITAYAVFARGLFGTNRGYGFRLSLRSAGMTAASAKEVAMSKQTRPIISAEQFTARVEVEKAALQRHYCDVFKFWRACPLARCRMARRCDGDAALCLKGRAGEIPRHQQWQARQQVLRSTPASAGEPERAVRELMPYDLVDLDKS